MPEFSRRWVLSGLMAGVAAPALANAPLRSLVPPSRPAGPSGATGPADPPQVTSAEALIEAAQLSGEVGFVVIEAATGAVLEHYRPELALPPASVIKAITAQYALEALGPGHRFTTRLLATGPIENGRLDGDLVLLGGGDPVLTSDDLGDMAVALRERGLREVAGRFIVHGRALPSLPLIDPAQPVQVSYNPALSGLNLNFNRVNFQWKRNGDGYEVAMDAPDLRYRPQTRVAQMRVVDRSSPVYTYDDMDEVDAWTVASAALGNGGSRWLPVRRPELYAGDVFRNIAAYHEMSLPAAQLAGTGRIEGREVVTHRSETLREIVEDMLLYSTNVTAEILGLSASLARGGSPRTLPESAAMMADWAALRFGLQRTEFRDHSGLGDGSRISAADMVRFLAGAGRDGPLRDVLREITLRDERGNPVQDYPATVTAKTGTLNFVSGLGGYIALPSGKELIFATFTADLETRERIPVEQRERPVGGRAWAGRARRLQHALIDRWAILYG